MIIASSCRISGGRESEAPLLSLGGLARDCRRSGRGLRCPRQRGRNRHRPRLREARPQDPRNRVLARPDHQNRVTRRSSTHCGPSRGWRRRQLCGQSLKSGRPTRSESRWIICDSRTDSSTTAIDWVTHRNAELRSVPATRTLRHLASLRRVTIPPCARVCLD